MRRLAISGFRSRLPESGGFVALLGRGLPLESVGLHLIAEAVPRGFEFVAVVALDLAGDKFSGCPMDHDFSFHSLGCQFLQPGSHDGFACRVPQLLQNVFPGVFKLGLFDLLGHGFFEQRRRIFDGGSLLGAPHQQHVTTVDGLRLFERESGKVVALYEFAEAARIVLVGLLRGGFAIETLEGFFPHPSRSSGCFPRVEVEPALDTPPDVKVALVERENMEVLNAFEEPFGQHDFNAPNFAVLFGDFPLGDPRELAHPTSSPFTFLGSDGGFNGGGLETVQGFADPLVLTATRFAVHPGEELIRREVNSSGRFQPQSFGIDPMGNREDEQILIMDRGHAAFTGRGDSHGFGASRPVVLVSVFNRFRATGRQAEPAARHQIDLIFRRKVAALRCEPLQSLILSNPTFFPRYHAYRHSMSGFRKQYRHSSDLLPAGCVQIGFGCAGLQTFVGPATLPIVGLATLSSFQRLGVVIRATLVSTVQRPRIVIPATQIMQSKAVTVDLRSLKLF